MQLNPNFTYSAIGPNALTRDQIYSAIDNIQMYRKILYEKIIIPQNEYYQAFLQNLAALGATNIVHLPDHLHFDMPGRDLHDIPAFYLYQMFHDAMYRLYIGIQYHLMDYGLSYEEEDKLRKAYYRVMDGIIPLNLCYNVVCPTTDSVDLYI